MCTSLRSKLLYSEYVTVTLLPVSLAVKVPTSVALEISLPPAPTSSSPEIPAVSWLDVVVKYQPQRLQVFSPRAGGVGLPFRLGAPGAYPNAVPMSHHLE